MAHGRTCVFLNMTVDGIWKGQRKKTELPLIMSVFLCKEHKTYVELFLSLPFTNEVEESKANETTQL